jgi:hypothetical protein
MKKGERLVVLNTLPDETQRRSVAPSSFGTSQPSGFLDPTPTSALRRSLCWGLGRWIFALFVNISLHQGEAQSSRLERVNE